ncbi:MAG TPA: VWA domain-containing protein [Thermoleophilaceae bacterium]
MSFGNPIWLLALLALPLLLLLLFARQRRGQRYAVRFTGVANVKLAAAMAGPSWRKHIPTALALFALALLTFALARPERSVAVPVGSASVMLVTDHSLSMEANDVQPDRLSAAQNAAHTFLNRVPKQVRIGVVAYSDSPDTVQAPSEDHSQARDVIDAQQPGGATDTGDALAVAIQALGNANGGKKVPSSIVLLSDGRTTTGRDPVGVAREAAKLHIPIYTVSLGTETALIPNPGGFGPPVPVPPDPATMRQIARASGGRAFTAEDDSQLSSIYKTLGSQLGTKSQKKQITASFAIAGIAMLIAAGATSARISGRLP